MTKQDLEFDIDIDLDLIKPKMYKVILHNDDYTTFDFVVYILMEIFNKTQEEAELLTIKIDSEGLAIIGVYPKDIAETKVNLVKEIAKEEKFPLLATMEEE